jgi:hypothetical protein
MKKKMTMITLAILVTSVFSLQAGIRVGIKGGVNLAKPAFNTSALKTENFTGFQVGPVIEVSGITGLGVDAAILYSQQGLKIKDIDLEEKVSTIDIPVNLKLKLSLVDVLGCYLSAGPYISFKVDEQTSFHHIKMDWKTKKFGVGLNFGAGLELVKHLQVGVNYQLALNDDYGNFSISDLKDDLKAKTRIWSITAAYFF